MKFGGIYSTEFANYSLENLKNIKDCTYEDSKKNKALEKFIMLMTGKIIEERNDIIVTNYDNERIQITNILLCSESIKCSLCGKDESGIAYGVYNIERKKFSVMCGSCLKKSTDITNEQITNIKNICMSMLFEIRYIKYIHSMDATNIYKETYYKNADAIIESNINLANTLLGETTAQVICEMINSRLPLPMILIKEYKNRFIKVIEGENKDVEEEAINNCLINSRHSIERAMSLKLYAGKHAEDYLNYEKDITKKIEFIKALQLLVDNYEKINVEKLEDIVNRGKSEWLSVITKTGIRFASKEEIKAEKSYIFKRKEYVVGSWVYKKCAVVVWMITGNKEMEKGLFRASNKVVEKFNSVSSIMKQSIEFTLDETEINSACEKINIAEEKDFEYPEKADIRDVKIAKEVAEEVIQSNMASTYAYKIAKDIERKNKANSWEFNILANEYVNIKNKSGRLVISNDGADMYSQIAGITDNDKEIIRNMDTRRKERLNKSTEFCYNIIDGVLRFKKCSVKQMAVIEKTYFEIEKAEGNKKHKKDNKKWDKLELEEGIDKEEDNKSIIGQTNTNVNELFKNII